MKPRLVPERELTFASRTGFLSKDLWEEFFAGSLSRSWRHDRWLLLTERGAFLDHPSGQAQGVIVPNPRSPIVRHVCPEGVVKPPFISQLRHDEILARGLLTCLKSGVVRSFTNEAVLRKSEASGLSLAEVQKLPDLIVKLKSGSTVAVELELTAKSSKRYWSLLNAYSSRSGLDAIVFVVESRSVLETIAKAARGAMFQAVPIGFIELKAWARNAGTAEIAFSDSTSSLARL